MKPHFFTAAFLFIPILSLLFFAFGCSSDNDDSDSGSDDDITDDDTGDDDDNDNDDNDDNDNDNDTSHGDADMEGWVVGYSDVDDQRYSIIWHDDHGVWEQETSPILGSPNQLADVFFLAPDDGWAVGYEISEGVILHRDATGWSQATLSGIPCAFAEVEFLDADHGWALCAYVSDTLAYRYDMGTWSAVPFSLTFEDTVVLYDVSLLAPDHAFVAGLVTVASGSAIGLEYLDGAIVGWMPSSYFDWYEGMQIAGGNEGYLAYCSWRSSFNPLSLYRFDGDSWLPAPHAPDAGCVSDFARSSGGTWYAAGYDEEPSVHRKQTTGWLNMPLPSVTGSAMWSGLLDIDMPADDFGVAVGGNSLGRELGYAFSFDGVSWHQIDDIAMDDTTYTGVSFVSAP